MITSFKAFNPEDQPQDYIIKKVGMTIQLINIPTKRVIDYRLLHEHINDINPAWFEHEVELLRNPFMDIIVPMPEFLCRHNSMIDRLEAEDNERLAIMN